MDTCQSFLEEVEAELGGLLRSGGYVPTGCAEADGCRLYFESAGRELCIYNSVRNGEVNCLVRGSGGGDWITVSEAIGRGRGLTDPQLIDRMPEKPLGNAEMLRELGSMLQQLDS